MLGLLAGIFAQLPNAPVGRHLQGSDKARAQLGAVTKNLSKARHLKWKRFSNFGVKIASPRRSRLVAEAIALPQDIEGLGRQLAVWLRDHRNRGARARPDFRDCGRRVLALLAGDEARRSMVGTPRWRAEGSRRCRRRGRSSRAPMARRATFPQRWQPRPRLACWEGLLSKVSSPTSVSSPGTAQPRSRAAWSCSSPMEL